MQVLTEPGVFSSRNPTGPTSATAIARHIQAGTVNMDGLDEAERARLHHLAQRRAAIGSAPALVSADPPVHTRQRDALAPAFAAERIAELETSVAAIAGQLVDAFVDRGQVELVAEFSRPFALRVIAIILGMDEPEVDKLARWSDAFTLAVGSAQQEPRELLDMFEQISEFYDYFTEPLQRAQRESRDDLLGLLANAPNRADADADATLAEKLQMLSGLVVAGYTTTRDLLSSLMLRLADSDDGEDRLRSDMSRLPDLIEEVLRVEAPTAGIHRTASENTRLGGVDIPAGSFVFLDFHAANLDPRAFESPRELKYDRPQRPVHLSLGYGAHACIAASLARMQARIALEVLVGRLQNVKLQATPETLAYRPSWASRGLIELPLTFEPNVAGADTTAEAGHRPVVVADQQLVAERTLEIVLRSPDGAALPAWEPGAHIELLLPSGNARQYSLCGNPAERTAWRIAVLEEVDGRGGSAELHRLAKAGVVLQAHPPRNHFPLKDGVRFLFIAGGIGVTPILTMIEEVQRRGAEWTLVYGGRSRSAMAYLDRIAAYTGGTVDVWPEDERGRPDLAALLAAQDAQTQLYACGPTGLLDAITEAHAAVHGLQPLRIERFAAAGPIDVSGGAFEVQLAKSGQSLIVEEGTSILATVRAVLPRLSYSCEEGYCGECETAVLEGTPDHRDDFLSDEERESGTTMMICVSRSCSSKLVLDL
jgi:cytochrome P450/ferredoxin-NADP reductase